MHKGTPNRPWLCARCAQAVRTASYRGAKWSLVMAQHRPCRRCAVPCRTLARSYRNTSPAVSQHCIATRLAAKPLSLCHDTIDYIVTRPQPDCLLVTIQRLYRDTTPQRLAPRLCHDTIPCIATQSTSQVECARAAGHVVPSLGRIAGLAAWQPGHVVAPRLRPGQPPNLCVTIRPSAC